MNDARISGFYRLPIDERIDALEERGWLDAAAAATLRRGGCVLDAGRADRMVENVIGVFGLPLAIATNFRVDGVDRLVPMVVEEPSIVAGSSAAARRARESGGFVTSLAESLLTAQIHVTDMADVDAARAAVLAARDELLAAADAVHPRLLARGGGVRDFQVELLALPALAVNLYVDTGDAMGANLVNTIAEALAPRVAELTGGRVALRILSNLAECSVVTATARFSPATLAADGRDGEAVRDAIVRAAAIAAHDPRRAATHNKGIMNGIDAVCIATGNDWRAVEAGAHAWAARDGDYRSLSRWRVDADGNLEGRLELPLKLGIVGGTLDLNPAARLGLELSGVTSAAELARLAAAVGLAQNFAALNALATTGIQHGHMRLHARSVAAAAGATGAAIDAVVGQMIEEGNVKAWRAREILGSDAARAPEEGVALAAGKVIVCGEHAVVYGRHAVALPIPAAIAARAVPADGAGDIAIAAWGIPRRPIAPGARGVDAMVGELQAALGLADRAFSIDVWARIPPAMGLGASAALAVALARALCCCAGIDADDERINALALRCEQLAHGTPSGIDNTVATIARPVLFCNINGLHYEELSLSSPPPLLVACSHRRGATVRQVSAVRALRERRRAHVDALFAEIDALSVAAAAALAEADHATLGELMNLAHGLLNALGVSTAELESMVALARELGAAGAKLTGAGGGGSIVAACPGGVDTVASGFRLAGYRTLRPDAIAGTHGERRDG